MFAFQREESRITRALVSCNQRADAAVQLFFVEGAGERCTGSSAGNIQTRAGASGANVQTAGKTATSGAPELQPTAAADGTIQPIERSDGLTF